MDQYGSNWYARPSHMVVACSVCGVATPYDPTQQPTTCSNCRATRVSWSNNGYHMAQDMNYGYHTTNEPMGYHGSQTSSMGPYTPQNDSMGYHVAQGMDYAAASSMGPGTMGPSFGIKRKAELPLEANGYHGSKRVFSNMTAYAPGPLKHYTVGAGTIQLRGRSLDEEEQYDDDDDEDQFVDAPEEQQQYEDYEEPYRGVADFHGDTGCRVNGRGSVEEVMDVVEERK